VVPPGSREALSSGPNNPTSGFGETTLGDVAQSDPVRLPDLPTVFSTRAERLRALATGHELEGFLRMVAALVAAQHEALTDLPPGSLPGPAEIAKARLVQRSPLDPVTWPRDESWRVALRRLLDMIDDSVLPDPARAVRTALATMDAADLEALADRFLDGKVAAGEAAQALFVAAALQVAWTRMAALLDAADLGSGEPTAASARPADRHP